MRNLYVLVFVALLSLNTNSQTYSINWSRYFGGTGNESNGNTQSDFQQMADANYVYAVGNTNSTNLPVTDGSTYKGGTSDMYFAKFNRSTGALVFATYLGGSAEDYAMEMKVENGITYIFGSTQSTNLPITTGSGKDLFADFCLYKITAANAIGYCRYFGGNAFDGSSDTKHLFDVNNGVVALAHNNTAFSVQNFPVTDGSAVSTGRYLLAATFDANGNIIYSGYKLNNSTCTYEVSRVKLYNGEMYIALTTTNNSSFPIIGGGTAPTGSANGDISLLKLNSGGTITLATTIGGPLAFDNAINMDVNSSGIYILGRTSGNADFPETSGNYSSGNNPLLLKYNLSGALLYAVNPGGATSTVNADNLYAGLNQQMVIANGSWNITFQTSNAGITSTDGTTSLGSGEIFTAKFSTADGSKQWASYLGGTSNESSPAIVESNGYLGVIAKTTSANVPVTNGSGLKGTSDYLFIIYSPSGGRLFTSYIGSNGGSLYENGRNMISAYNGCFYGSGNVEATGFPVTGGLQTYAGANESIYFAITGAQNFTTTNTVAPTTQNTCFNGVMQTIVGNAITNPDGTANADYQWQVADAPGGPWTDIPGAIDKNYTPQPNAATKYYRRVATYNDCGTLVQLSISNTATVNAAVNTAPAVTVNGPLYTCGTTNVSFTATPAGGLAPYSYSWTPSTNLSPTTAATTSTITAPVVSSVYTVNVTDSRGCIGSSQGIVNVINSTAYPNAAGPDGNYCQGAATGVQLGTAPLPAASGVTYSWSPATGLSCTTCAQPIATPATTTTYTLTMTIPLQGGGTCTLTDNVVVNVVNRPAGNFAGPDVAFCYQTGGTIGLPPSAVTPVAITGVFQFSTNGVNNATVGNLTDGVGTTGGMTLSGFNNQFIRVDLGGVFSVSRVGVQALTSVDSLNGCIIQGSTSAAGPWINLGSTIVGTSTTALTNFDFAPVPVQYIRIHRPTTGRVGLSEIRVYASDYTYTWAPGSYLSNTAITNPTFNAGAGFPTPNPITYTLTATRLGCAFTDQMQVYVMESTNPLGINEGMAGLDGCGPRIIGIPDRTPGVNETYQWTRLSGDGNFLGSTTSIETPVSAGTVTTVYRLTSTLVVDGVTYTCTDDVTVPPCGCNILVMYDLGCAKGPGTKVTASSTAGAGTFTWTLQSGPAGGLSAYTGPVVYMTDNTTRTYRVTYTNTIDPTVTCFVDMVLNDPLYQFPVFSAPNVTACPNTNVTIGAAPVGGYNYAWTPSTGLSSTVISNPVSNTPSSISYIVNVTDAVTGCLTRDTVVVTRPVVTADGTDKNVCSAGAIVTLGVPDPSAGAWTYSWTPAGADWRNGTNQNSAQPDVFVSGTSQAFTLTVTEPTNGCTAVKVVNVNVSTAPTANAGADRAICSGATTSLLGAAAQTNVIYSWSPATGLSCTSCAQPQATLTNVTGSPITQTYTLTTSYPGGCSTSDDVIITVNPLPTATLSASSPYCATTGTALTGAPGPGFTYSWAPAAYLSSTTVQTPTTTSPVPTTYTLTLTNSTTFCVGTATVSVTPAVAANAGADKQVCVNTGITIGNAANTGTLTWTQVSGPATYTLTPSASSPNPTFTATAPGTYVLRLTKVESGCTTTDDVTIVVPNVTMPVLTPIVACQNSCVQIGTTPDGTKEYLWSPITGLSDYQIANPIACVGTSSVNYNLTITDILSGCTVSGVQTVSVAPNPAPQLSIPAVTGCDNTGLTIDLTVTSGNAPFTYSWSPAAGLSSTTVQDPVVTQAAGTYTYTVVVTDANGCQSTRSVTVTITNCVSLSGAVWNDINANLGIGTGESMINGTNTGGGLTTGAVLYVNLVDANGNVVATAPVAANGTYSFPNIPGNTNYTLQLTTNQGTVGQPMPATALPTGWSTTGENKNNNGGITDSTPNGLIPVSIGTTDVVNQNFGIQQAPQSAINVQQPLLNPGGTVNVPVPPSAFVFSENWGTPNGNPNSQDYNGGVVTSIRITAFPANITSITIGGVVYTASNWPVGGVVVPYADGYGPLVPISFDPIEGLVTVVIPFATIDNAGFEDPTPGSVTFNFTSILSINFLDFKANKHDVTKAILNWKVADQERVVRYEVERSANGRLFTSIGTVTATNAGSYNFTDLTPIKGINYYRIKAVGQNSNDIKYTAIIRISFAGELIYALYPNPAIDYVVLTIPDEVVNRRKEISIYSADGKAIMTEVIGSGVTVHVMRVNMLPAGTYMVRVGTEGFGAKTIGKVVITR